MAASQKPIRLLQRAIEIPGITSLCHLIIILICHFGIDFEYQVKVLLSDTITGKDGVCQNIVFTEVFD
jgi:hypothetical protein